MWLKITGFLSAALMVLLTVIGYKNKKIDRLEHKDRINDKIDTIRKAQEKHESRILGGEDEKIEAKLKIAANKSRVDRASKL